MPGDCDAGHAFYFVFNTVSMILEAALDGLGIAHLPEGQVQPHLDSGRLVRVLADWCPPFSGYHLYYPSRRQHSAAFALFVEALRFRERPASKRSGALKKKQVGS